MSDLKNITADCLILLNYYWCNVKYDCFLRIMREPV